MPVDLNYRLRSLPLRPRATFYQCFALARRTHPYLGYLVTEDLHALSYRQLATLLHIGLATAHSHINVLIERGFLVRDLGGKLLVPLVLDTERRFAPRTSTTTTKTTSGENGDASYVQEIAPFMGGVPPPNGFAQKPNAHSLSVCSADVEKDVTWRPSKEPGENPGTPLLGDTIAALPGSIHSPDVRYLLGKLAYTTPAWRGFPSAARDVALVERLEATACGALLSALEQETLSSTAKNPGAWLARTVAAIAIGQEVAS